MRFDFSVFRWSLLDGVFIETAVVYGVLLHLQARLMVP